MPETESIVMWLLVAVLVAGAVGGVLAVRKERKSPTSFTQAGTAGADNEALDAAELGETGRVRSQREWRAWESDTVVDFQIRADASEVAQRVSAQMAEAAKRNALFHP